MRAAAHARRLAVQRQKAAAEQQRLHDAQAAASSSSVVTRADVRASHRHKLWKALHANDWERHVHMVVDYEPEPLRILSKEAAMSSGGLRARRLRRENRTSTVVSERVYMALQRGPALVHRGTPRRPHRH